MGHRVVVLVGSHQPNCTTSTRDTPPLSLVSHLSSRFRIVIIGVFLGRTYCSLEGFLLTNTLYWYQIYWQHLLAGSISTCCCDSDRPSRHRSTAPHCRYIIAVTAANSRKAIFRQGGLDPYHPLYSLTGFQYNWRRLVACTATTAEYLIPHRQRKGMRRRAPWDQGVWQQNADVKQNVALDAYMASNIGVPLLRNL